MEKIALNINSENNTHEIIFREGQALPQPAPQKVVINGDLKSIGAFLNKRHPADPNKEAVYGSQLVNKDRVIIEVDKSAPSIVIYLDKESQYGTEVHGKLTLAEELGQFKINTSHQFKREELVRLLRFNKRFFTSPEIHEKVLSSYMKLDISTKSNLKDESDNRGNADLQIKKMVNSQNIPTEFALTVPVFKGYPPKTFRVEICLDVTDASVRFWLESTELVEVIESIKNEAIAEQLQYCNDFVVVNK